MKKKIIIILFLFIIFMIGFLVLIEKKPKNITIINESSAPEKIKVAACPIPIDIIDVDNKKIKVATCPTYLELTKNINSDKYEIIITDSTAESISLLQNKKVDFIISGRTLKPHEPQMEKIIIGEGYSFISKDSFSIYKNELKNYLIYTDLDPQLIKDTFPINKITKVADVYNYLNQGIVITTWENTDYLRAEIVHILEENRERAKLSRQATIYYPDSCGDLDAQELALLLK